MGRYLLTFSLPQWYSQPFPWVGTLLPWRPFRILLLQESCPELGSSEGIPTLDPPAGEKKPCKMKQGKEWLFLRNRCTSMCSVWLLFLSVSVRSYKSFWILRYSVNVFTLTWKQLLQNRLYMQSMDNGLYLQVWETGNKWKMKWYRINACFQNNYEYVTFMKNNFYSQNKAFPYELIRDKNHSLIKLVLISLKVAKWWQRYKPDKMLKQTEHKVCEDVTT